VNTLKTAALLAVLLGVLYGVYVLINKPDLGPSADADLDENAPSVEYNVTSQPTYSSGTAPPLSHGYDEPSPAAQDYSAPRGGAYQPSADGGYQNASASPAYAAPDASNSASGVARSGYESPTTSPASPDLTQSSQPPETASATSQAAADPSSPSLAAYSLRRDLTEAEQMVTEGRYRAALGKLTPYFRATDLPSDQRALLFSWLDALAGKVIYSREHILAPSHQVRRGETLFTIADQYHVSHRLLQSINNREINDPLVLVPGTELKVVPGPFRADIDLATGEMTMLVGELYAGRFMFALGDQPPQPGDYKVADKQQQQRTYYGLDGRIIPANDATNPYGGWWISLGGEAAIHGSAAASGNKTLGCISLSPQDAKDVYGILSIGSEVKIRK
jgi:LysM repeat protein